MDQRSKEYQFKKEQAIEYSIQKTMQKNFGLGKSDKREP